MELLVIGLALFCLLVDVTYFIKIIFHCCPYLFGVRKKSREMHDDVVSYGICLPFDIDCMWHMNHGKYLRNFEYARGIFVGETGLLSFVLDLRRTNRFFVIAAIAVRYRKPVTCFETYRIITKVVFAEGRHLFFEQWMVGLNDEFIRAVCYCKVTMTKSGDLREILRARGIELRVFRGPISEDLHHFIELNRASSEKLNPSKGTSKGFDPNASLIAAN